MLVSYNATEQAYIELSATLERNRQTIDRLRIINQRMRAALGDDNE
jgi:hypothetical protein